MAPELSISNLQEAAKVQVFDARRHSKLDQLTTNLVLRALESEFDLPDNGLNNDEYRLPIKAAIKEAATDDIPVEPVRVASHVASGSGSNDLTEGTNPTARTKKRKSEETAESKPRKKQDTKPEKVKKSSKQYKSREMIPTSDIEEAEDHETENTSAELDKPPATVPRLESSAKENQGASRLQKSNPTNNDAVAKASPRPPASATPEAAANSDSELSVLEDEPPKKAKRAKTTRTKVRIILFSFADGPDFTQGSDKSKTSKGKKTTTLTKDEETIKRLKSLVLACGVRKAWAKEFKDVDSPSQQIRMLKQILTDLGMSGRMSLEQAKAIKLRRELAQELEDVQAFAAATSNRSKRKPAEAVQEESEESEEEELPIKRKPNARKSIMAFLGDQSDDD
ncbi:hypothetical protein C8R47DRAFT_1314175 [Mycena vitilis]|nr:hypothetical protein C8R47DRAFT_1314175 [Mycena vitilis]